MSRLTTHVLDTTTGQPGAGIRIELYAAAGQRLTAATTNDEGRTAAPLLEGEAMTHGCFQLVFHIGEYFAQQSAIDRDALPFLDRVRIDFGIANPNQHYHVPLLVSPWSYTTYRGS